MPVIVTTSYGPTSFPSGTEWRYYTDTGYLDISTDDGTVIACFAPGWVSVQVADAVPAESP